MDDYNEIMKQRMNKCDELRSQKVNPYPNDFKVIHRAEDIFRIHATDTHEQLESNPTFYTIAGRVMAVNSFGKAAFIRIKDRSGLIQVYLRKNQLGPDVFAIFEKTDIGDIIGVSGQVFRTKTGELTIMASQFKLLTKSIRPLPEKWHGLQDKETRFRQRYVDLIVNDPIKDIFVKRAAIINFIREFLVERDFLEVETPMMQPIPGGANARPFITFHNALSINLYMRIAPELYLKRLIVGGFERVFEINRNFRNEGLSQKHNPEFTMLEFYQAYATYEDLMILTEQLISSLANRLFELELKAEESKALRARKEDETAINDNIGAIKERMGKLAFAFGDNAISYKPPFRRLTIREALLEYGPGIKEETLTSAEALYRYAESVNLEINPAFKDDYGRMLMEVFEGVVESKLVQPTFITQFPIEVSPLSRRNEANPGFVDRFELYVAGSEIANAFSELNDPVDQRGRFEAQARLKEKGDEEAHVFDHDYIRALEYGMPPTGGEGIGIDRLTMLFTNQESIREVILFPLLRPEV